MEFIEFAKYAGEYFVQQTDRQFEGSGRPIGDLAGTVYWGSGRPIGDLADRLGIWQADFGSGRQILDLAGRFRIWQADWHIWSQLTNNIASANRCSLTFFKNIFFIPY